MGVLRYLACAIGAGLRLLFPVFLFLYSIAIRLPPKPGYALQWQLGVRPRDRSSLCCHRQVLVRTKLG